MKKTFRQYQTSHGGVGETINYRCRNYVKVGYERCCKQVKVVYPDNDETVLLYETAK